MNLTQFVSCEEERYGIANVRLFRRLDSDEDGLLSVTEFAAQDEAMFDKVDKNHDGVLTPAELQPRVARTKQHDQSES